MFKAIRIAVHWNGHYSYHVILAAKKISKSIGKLTFANRLLEPRWWAKKMLNILRRLDLVHNLTAQASFLLIISKILRQRRHLMCRQAGYHLARSQNLTPCRWLTVDKPTQWKMPPSQVSELSSGTFSWYNLSYLHKNSQQKYFSFQTQTLASMMVRGNSHSEEKFSLAMERRLRSGSLQQSKISCQRW